VLAFGPIVYLGRMSYSLYLWHGAVFAMFGVITASGPASGSNGQRVAAIALSLVVAAASYELVEKPILRRGGRAPGTDVPARRTTGDEHGARVAVLGAAGQTR
jgi:peptidoglycan/LPS O-acetylase OafA/YrhL